MKTKKIYSSLIGSLVVFGGTGSILQAQDAIPTTVETLEDLKKIQSQIQAVVKKVQPATVALTSTKTGAAGSGVIINRAGLILTAAHVVENNTEISVIFPDGKAFVAKVLGSNKTKDVSMIQLVEKKDWPYAEIGDSDSLVIGSHVIAMGHPGGYDAKRPAPVRFGRLLSKNRNGFITTDSVLIGGDSGGPLFDMNGKVIGINSSIGKTWLTNNHAGVSSFLSDWDRLQKGEIWGKLIQSPLDDPDSPVMGFTFEEIRNVGVVVMEVLDDSPAAKAGFKSGDIISAIENEKISDGRDLLVSLSPYKSDDTIEVTLLRKEEEIKLKITLVSRGKFFNQ